MQKHESMLPLRTAIVEMNHIMFFQTLCITYLLTASINSVLVFCNNFKRYFLDESEQLKLVVSRDGKATATAGYESRK